MDEVPSEQPVADKYKVVLSVPQPPALNVKVAVPVIEIVGVWAEPLLEVVPNFAHCFAPFPSVKLQPELSAVSVEDAMLPLQLPSLPPVPSQELKVSENNVTFVCPFIPKGIIKLIIKAKAAIKKVKFLFIL